MSEKKNEDSNKTIRESDVGPEASQAARTKAEPDIERTIAAAPLRKAEEIKAAEAKVLLEWNIGDVILDLYEVKDIHKGGGMGLVYRVHHRGWNIDLAVKSPRADWFKTEEQKENFVRECETWINLGLHPHTVSCYYVRTLGGIPHVFAEYIEGGSLSDWVKTRKLYEGGQKKALERILDIAIQFAWGLHYAHEQGLIHQDVKPANVMMTPDGTPKVTDFGLAKARGLAGEGAAVAPGRSVLVSTGGMTPAYCSPEQAGKEKLSRKTDIWSWGLSVLEMFTGEVTWMAGQAAPEVLEAHLNAPAETVLIPPMPEPVADLLRQCFKVGPRSRPPNMESVADRLCETYAQIYGAYSRPAPKAVQLTPDAHNNRALSYLDLGKEAKASDEWKAALAADPQHVTAIYNEGVYLWRRAELTDEGLRLRLEAARSSHTTEWRDEYLLALVEIERGDLEAAVSLLTEVTRLGSGVEEAENLLKLIRSGSIPSGRKVRSLEGHEGMVHGISLSADGRRALTTGEDKTVRYWDVATGRCLRELDDFSAITVKLSADGQQALSGHDDGSLRLWHMETGNCLRTFKFQDECDRPRPLCLSPDGRYALSNAAEKKLRLWDVTTGKCLRTLSGHTGNVLAVSMSADNRWALSSSIDMTLRLWDIETGQTVRVLSGHQKSVSAVCISADGQWGLSGSSDSTIRLWELPTGSCLRVFQARQHGRQCEDYDNMIDRLSWSQDTRWILSSGLNAQLWDMETGKCLRTLQRPKMYGVRACMSADARWALVVSGSNTVDVWELPTHGVYQSPLQLSRVVSTEVSSETARLASTLVQQAEAALDEHRFIDALAHLEKARELPGLERTPESLSLWRRLSRYGVRARLRGAWPAKILGESQVNACCISPDGRLALAAGRKWAVDVWDLATSRRVRTLQGHEAPVKSVCLSADGRLALSAGEDQSLRVWETDTGKCLQVLHGQHGGLEDKIRCVSLSADGLLALSGGWDKIVRLWDIRSGECVTFGGHTAEVESVLLSPDGMLALSGGRDRTLRLWDTRSGACLRTFEGHNGAVLSIALSADLEWLLSAGGDNTIRKWELATGRCLSVFKGHSNFVFSISLTVDGRFAASGGDDRTVRIWEVKSGICIQTLEAHDFRLETVCLSPDGGWALSGGQDKGLQVWELDWDLDALDEADWDDGAQPYLASFLAWHVPLAAWKMRVGTPVWSERDFNLLLNTLACAGYGWLRPEGVRKQLEKMAKRWGGKPTSSSALSKLFGKKH